MAILKIGVIADVHAAPADSPSESWQGGYAPAEGAALARQAIARLRSESIDALFVLGDSANNGDHQSMKDAVAAVSSLSVPTWIVAGNVDLRRSQSELEDSLAAVAPNLRLPTAMGRPFQGFIEAGLRFNGAPDDEIALTNRPNIAAWRDEPVLLLSHYPVISRHNEALAGGWKYSGDAVGLTDLDAELAKRRAPTIVFHGHLHLKDAVANGTLLQLGFPALIESGHQFAIVTISSDAGDIRLNIAWLTATPDDRPVAKIGEPASSWIFTSHAWLPLAPSS
jgi:Icc-related predicted phosphoesterase